MFPFTMARVGDAVLYFSLFVLLCGFSTAVVVEQYWSVEYHLESPDCVEKVIMGINGSHPGPTVRAKEGDRIILHVTNNLFDSQAITVHFHGIHQQGTPFMDGSDVSQCPIPRLETFVYNFTVEDQCGTFWWHAHTGLQRAAGLYGMVVIECADGDPFEYDGVHELTLIDWFAGDVKDIAMGLELQTVIAPNKYRWPGLAGSTGAQSVLINGQGYYNCSRGTDYIWSVQRPRCQLDISIREELGNNKPGNCELPRFEVEKGKTYLLRLVNAGVLNFMTVHVQGHNLTVVRSDGRDLVPFQHGWVDLAPGESFEALLTANDDSDVSAFWIAVRLRVRFETVRKGDHIIAPMRAFAIGQGVLQYKGRGTGTETPTGPIPGEYPEWNDFHSMYMFAHKLQAGSRVPRPPKVDLTTLRRLFLVGYQNDADDYRERYGVNSVTWKAPKTPPLIARYYGKYDIVDDRKLDSPPAPPFTSTYDYVGVPWEPNSVLRMKVNAPGEVAVPGPDPKRWPLNKYGQLTFNVKRGDTVLIILQNLMGIHSVAPPHPGFSDMSKVVWNMSHQHPWHLHGNEFWVLARDTGNFNFDQDSKKFNLVNPPMKSTIDVLPLGWAALLATFDNPGIWPFHCHVDPHFHMGMATAFNVLSADGESLPPLPPNFPTCGEVAKFQPPTGHPR